MSSERVWAETLERKKDEIAPLLTRLELKQRKKGIRAPKPVTLDEAISHKDVDSFHVAVQALARQFASKRVPTLFKKYLYPILDHVRFFSNAIASAAQYEPTGSLVWGLLFIVIQCGCIFAENIEGILSQLADLEKLLPYFQKDMSLYPKSKAIEYSLQTIFEDYIDFCLMIIRDMGKNPLLGFLRNIWSSSLRQNLNSVKTKLKGDVSDFDRAVKTAERSRAIIADERIQGQLTILTAQTSGTRQGNNSNVQFPVESVFIAENSDFSGRDAELNKLHSILVLSHKEARPLSCAIHGIGGIGKTETALKFLYKYKKDFDAVFWVSADPEQETETLRTFGNIGRRLGLFDTDVVLEPHIEIVLEWLQTEGWSISSSSESCLPTVGSADLRWLLIFDNVVEWKSIARFWPSKSRKASAIIVTSQLSTPWTNHQLDLEPFDAKEGSEFLLDQMHLANLDANDPTREIAGEISKELGGSPLYLTHAHGFMSLSKCTPDEYLNIIRTRSNTLDFKSKGTWRYGRAASTTHDRILQELSLGAKDLLFMLAFMNPDEVKEDFLLLDHEYEDLKFLSDKSTYLSYIAELGVGKLVRREVDGTKSHLRIHRATQAAMLQKLNDHLEERDRAFNRVIRLVRENFADPSMSSKLQIAEAHVWPLITKVLPHILSAFNCFERAWPSMKGDRFLAQLLYDVAGMDLYDRGRITEAYKINKMVTEKILTSLNTPFASRLMADSLSIVGLCTDWMALSKREEGLKIRRRQSAIRESCYALIAPQDVKLEDKIWLHNGYTDLVCSLQQVNEFDEARELLEKCFEQYKTWGAEDKIPYEYSKYYNQMAYILLHENGSTKAVEFAKRGYELVEQATPGTQIAVLYKFDYTNILFQHGDSQEAFKLLKEMLKDSKRDCGKDNVRTLELRLNLGIVSFYLNNLDYAEKQIKKVLSMKSQELWPIENFVRGKYYLSQVLKKRNPNDQAATIMEDKAKESLQELLKLDSTGKAKEYEGDYPMLFDFLVHWECRLVTPRKKEIAHA